MRIDVTGKPCPFRVLVATDGSAHARAAVAATRLFPWRDGARADGVMAWPIPGMLGRRRSVRTTSLSALGGPIRSPKQLNAPQASGCA